MNNTLNISELLKRAGVVGDSLGSAPLLEQLRMGVQIADLSQLVPPLRGPMAAGSRDVIPGTSKFGNWSLRCGSQGGLQILSVIGEGSFSSVFGFFAWISDVNPWAAPSVVPLEQLSFEQIATSEMTTGTPGVSVAPASAIFLPRAEMTLFCKDIWLGPGKFLNFELTAPNAPIQLSISWMEYTGALNP